MLLLCTAHALIRFVPLRRWRGRLGLRRDPGSSQGDGGQAQVARRLARHVERAAGQLPFATRCLPRAMALSWLLRRRRIAHALVIAVRPAGQRAGEDALHAWVEHRGKCIIGDLPGPWHAVLRAGEMAQAIPGDAATVPL